MKRIDKRLIETADLINKELSKVNSDNRAVISSSILSHLRHFCEAFMYKIYDEDKNEDLFQTHDNLKTVRKYISDNYCDSGINNFHSLLEKSVSHITFGYLQSEALAIKYIPYLINIKEILRIKYGIDVLQSIYKYPLDLDTSLIDFYNEILSTLNKEFDHNSEFTRNQYFIKKRSMKYINNTIFYEYVFDVSDDKPNQFNTFVCYSFQRINFNYDLKLKIAKKEISFLSSKITINIIYDYEYSIRPCTFKNLLYLINYDEKDGKRDDEYKSLMRAIKMYNISLLDIVDGKFNFKGNGYYSSFISRVTNFVKNNNFGANIIRFLLYEMKNSVIRVQKSTRLKNGEIFNPLFNNLRIGNSTISFDLMPFAFNPKYTKTSLSTLLDIFDPTDKEDEILYRSVLNYINENNTLFIKPKDLGYNDDIFIKLVSKFNDKLHTKNSYYDTEKIIEIHGYYTIESYLESTKIVLKRLINLAKKKNDSFGIINCNSKTISDEKKEVINSMFLNSHISIITGSPGTGKTLLIKEFAKTYADKRILCLTTTNTALNNLKIDNALNVKYMNITQWEKGDHEYFDFIIVDECSFVSTKSIKTILCSNLNGFFLFVGDAEQLQSIDFGNWFSLSIKFLKKYKVVHELFNEYRTDVKELFNIWDEIKKGNKNCILELLSSYNMTEKINPSIFEINENEIVLCLNYDGLYGINNINRYLQASNQNKSYEYQQNIYKVNDPVVFIVNDYAKYGIYNNLKGKITNIIESDYSIKFEIQIFTKAKAVNNYKEISIENRNGNCYVIVTKIKYYDKYDTDMTIRNKLPFQVSYAMSIHKAQGLEFDSVKIVITKESDELINKNIFYTAITRAKKNLIIYWEPEVANYVLTKIEKESESKEIDFSLLKETLKDTLK